MPPWEKFSHSLSFEVQIAWKLLFNAIDGSLEKLKNSLKSLKKFASPRQWPATHEIKASYVSGTKFPNVDLRVYKENLFSKCSKNVDLGRLEVVQNKCFI